VVVDFWSEHLSVALEASCTSTLQGESFGPIRAEVAFPERGLKMHLYILVNQDDHMLL